MCKLESVIYTSGHCECDGAQLIISGQVNMEGQIQAGKHVCSYWVSLYSMIFTKRSAVDCNCNLCIMLPEICILLLCIAY